MLVMSNDPFTGEKIPHQKSCESSQIYLTEVLTFLVLCYGGDDVKDGGGGGVPGGVHLQSSEDRSDQDYKVNLRPTR